MLPPPNNSYMDPHKMRESSFRSLQDPRGSSLEGVTKIIVVFCTPSIRFSFACNHAAVITRRAEEGKKKSIRMSLYIQEEKRRFNGVGNRLFLSDRNRRFGPGDYLRAQEPREALRGRKSWKSRPPADACGEMF